MTSTYAQIVERWQQRRREALLIEGEWVAGRIAQAIEDAAQRAMEALCGTDEEPEA